jgi:hypothetical protein
LSCDDISLNKLTYMDPPVMSRKFREEKHV